MTALEIPFELGVPIWVAECNTHQRWIECPECCGTKALTLINGNGVEVSLECRCCQDGYDPPKGIVRSHVWEARPKPFTPRRFRCDGEEWMFSESEPDAASCGSFPVDRLFKDRDDCQRKCDQMNAEHAKEQAQSLIHQVTRGRRDVAWSVHYWGRQVKELEASLERARARLSACKDRKKSAASPSRAGGDGK